MKRRQNNSPRCARSAYASTRNHSGVAPRAALLRRCLHCEPLDLRFRLRSQRTPWVEDVQELSLGIERSFAATEGHRMLLAIRPQYRGSVSASWRGDADQSKVRVWS